jgi:hypothetical protein
MTTALIGCGAGVGRVTTGRRAGAALAGGPAGNRAGAAGAGASAGAVDRGGRARRGTNALIFGISSLATRSSDSWTLPTFAGFVT